MAQLSLSQEGQWLFQHLFPRNPVLNTFRLWRPPVRLDHEVMGLVVSEIVRRHEILRTSFRVIDGRPMQVIRAPEPAHVGELDLTGLPSADRKARLVAWVRQQIAKPFDLAADTLFRADLIRLSGDEEVVLFNLHHIVCDGWSFGVLAREAAALCEAYAEGRRSPLAELPLQYRDYAAWQRLRLNGEALERQLSFWRVRLAGAPDGTPLPLDKPRPSERSFEGARLSVSVESSLVAKLRLLAKQEHATVFMVLAAALATVLHRYSGATDIVIGSPVANRGFQEIEPLIGLFMNTVALRLDLNGDPPFRSLLRSVRDEVMHVFDHQDVAFDSVLNDLGIRRDSDRSPLFQVMLTMQPPKATSGVPSLDLDTAGLAPGGAKFDLTLNFGEDEAGQLSGDIEYASDLFEAVTIERLFGHLTVLLGSITVDPLCRLSMLPMLGDGERRQLTGGWNATAAAYPQVCLHDRFDEQAARTPDATALRFCGRELSYGALQARANRLAWFLRGAGVTAETIVGLHLRRSPEQVVAMLAIMKAGGAAMPLDPTAPPARLARIVANARPAMIVSESPIRPDLADAMVPLVRLDRDAHLIEACPAIPLPSLTRPDNLAYVLHTSGTTGDAKGVMGTHRALVNRLAWDIGPAQPDDVYVQKTTLSFIDSLWEIFMPLTRGRVSVIAPDEAASDPGIFVDLLSREGVTRIVVVPSFLQLLLDQPDLARRLPRLRHCACSGEVLPASLVATFRARLPNVELVNIYGTSEFWDATWCQAGGGGETLSVPIGSPIANMRAHILDDRLEPVPINVPGELFVGGVGLARGYLARPDLTADRFLPDPFGDGERLYRTGDMVVRRADGRIDFLYRRDHQVKLRGHRIELREVEHALETHPQLRQAIVLLRNDLRSHEASLVAYVVHKGVAPSGSSLREHLLAMLPVHMVPAYFVFVMTLPMTSSGKVDRTALPRPQLQEEPSNRHAAPQTDLERMLAAIWSAVLGVPSIGIDDNFFEMGGSSMTLVRVQSLVRERLDRDISVVALFRYPTIRALGSYLFAGHRDDILVGSTKRGEARQRFLTRRRIDARPS